MRPRALLRRAQRRAVAGGLVDTSIMADNPLQNVSFPSGGRTAHGYLALPESGAGPGVIVI